MIEEYTEKLLVILSGISGKLETIPFWKDWNFWGFLALLGTLFFLFKYTRATEKMAEYQILPAVDVNMIYDSNVKKTYFWFSNPSKMPARVLIEVEIESITHKTKVGPLRISPNNAGIKTATSFVFKSPGRTDSDVILNITVTPAINDSKLKIRFTKSYRFNQEQSRWDETSWGYPDPPFPDPQNQL